MNAKSTENVQIHIPFQPINHRGVTPFMKCIFFLFLVFNCSAFGQSIDRQLYVRYFKSLYPYEPAVVREQQMEELSEWRIDQWQHDTLTKRTKFAQFRPDGRPTFYTLKQPYGGDSLIYTFQYDSLNNLVEYKLWSSYNVSNRGIKYTAHYLFNYIGNRLQKVQLFAYDESWSSERMVYSDTLTYSVDLKYVTINNGKTVTKLQDNGVFHGKLKAVDNEQEWKTSCQYKDTNLQIVQRFFQVACLSNALQASAKERHFFYETKMEMGSALVYNEADFRKQTIGFYLDTVKKELFSKSVSSTSEPTSLEDRLTNTATLSHFTPSLLLDYTITTREVSRGNHEYGRDSIQTFYTYTPFGWQQQSIEYHYPTHQMVLRTNDTESEKPSYIPVYILKEWLEWKKRE